MQPKNFWWADFCSLCRNFDIQSDPELDLDPQEQESAEEALEVTERTSFKLFILDLNLPGMNGVELCKEIRSHSPMAICIAVSGYASLFELHDCREAGFEDYFTKPVSLVELNEVVEQAFQKLERWKKR